MPALTDASTTLREPALLGQTVVLIGGSSGIGLETARAARRENLRITLPIRRIVTPQDDAAFAVHVMVNTAITGATFDIDGGQQLT